MSSFKKAFTVTVLPFAAWLGSGIVYELVYGDIGYFLNLPLIGYLSYIIVILAAAAPALIWSEKVYPKYLKEFNEEYRQKWDSGNYILILSILIAYPIVSIFVESCGYAGTNSCRGFLESIQMFYTAHIEKPGSYVFAPQKGLETIGIFLGLLASSSIILKESIPRLVFYWKTRK